MMATRLKQFGLLLFSMLICGVAFFQMFDAPPAVFRRIICGCSLLSAHCS